MSYCKVCVFSHIGNSRSLQEDNYLLNERTMLIPDVRDAMTVSQPPHYVEIHSQKYNFCAFVCDGMGGQAHGEVASDTAVRLLSKQYDTILCSAAVSQEELQRAFQKINADFCEYAQSKPELKSMGTTLCGIVVKDDHVFSVNAGDSRLYVMRTGVLEQVTIDHTEGQRLMNLGFLSEAEAARLPHRKAIHRYLGQNTLFMPDVNEVHTVLPGTMFMLATDGLTDVVDKDELCEVLGNQGMTAEQKGKELVSRAITRNLGYGDNITIVLVEM